MRWDELFLRLKAARCCRSLPAVTTPCPGHPHLREGKSSKADTEHNVALGCLCAFCSAATFMNQLINHIRTALPPCLSLIGRGRFGARVSPDGFARSS